jgi:hypothetical protein
MLMNIIYGVIASAIVAASPWLIRRVRMKRNANRGEPLIEGKWHTTFEENGQVFHENVLLTQNGRKVKGELVLEDGTETRYKFSGAFKHLILTGTYEATDPKDYEQGAFALRYANKTLNGQYILSRGSDQLVTSNYKWERVK